MDKALRVIVTRSTEQAGSWLDALTAQGLLAESFPLIEIADALNDVQRNALQARAAQMDVCMWVSSNAVGHFFKQNRPLAQGNDARAAINNIVSLQRIRHWATGPGTVAALQQHGIASAQIDAPDMQAAQWDSDALWQRVASQMQASGGELEPVHPELVEGYARPSTSSVRTEDKVNHQSPVQASKTVLILRGEDVGTPSASRDWLAQQIRAAGGVVEFAAVYQRRAPQFSAAQMAWAHEAAHDGSVWVFSSSQAVTHLPAIAGGWGQARCIVTHPRIAEAARAKGIAVVCTSRPAIMDVVQSLKSLT
jgi:uroporphyrinogen-III synthase